MQKIKNLKLIFVVCLTLFAFGNLCAQPAPLFSELVEKIEQARTSFSISPKDKLNQIELFIKESQIINSESAFLLASILKAELLIDLEDRGAAGDLLPELFTLANKLQNDEALIRLEIVDLAIKDARGQLEKMDVLHSQMLAKVDTAGNKKLSGDIYLAVGRSQYNMGRYINAISTLNEAYQLYESVGDKRSVGKALNSMANLNNELLNTEIALGYLEKALVIAQEAEDKFEVSIIFYNMSNSYFFSDDLEKAKEYMMKALNMSVELEDHIGVEWAKKKLADYHLSAEEWKSALNLYRDIEPFFRASGDVLMQHEILISQSRAYLELNLLDEAKEKAKQSAEFLDKLETYFYQERYGAVIADLEYAQENYKGAFDMLSDTYAFAKKAYLKEKQFAIEKYQVQFDTELKDKENRALASEIELTKLKVLQQSSQQKIWWLVASFITVLLLIAAGMLYSQTRNRNYFKEMALKDHLTGSSNRRAILEYAEACFSESQRTGKNLSLALIDLDNFKKINDRYGHKMGDQVLQSFAQACRNTIRQYDQFGRYGGEEWLIVFSNNASFDIEDVFIRIRDESNRIIKEVNPGFQEVTFSMGSTRFMSEQDDSLQTVINRADKNLYRAKEQGRDQVVF